MESERQSTWSLWPRSTAVSLEWGRSQSLIVVSQEAVMRVLSLRVRRTLVTWLVWPRRSERWDLVERFQVWILL